jgi:hypothetical protein
MYFYSIFLFRTCWVGHFVSFYFLYYFRMFVLRYCYVIMLLYAAVMAMALSIDATDPYACKFVFFV